MPRVLHVLSQRPSLTGSGVTLDAIVRHAADDGWRQHVVVGLPEGEPPPSVGDLGPECLSAVTFGSEPLGFPVPGMSDVMPYPSTRFSSMTAAQLAAYRDAWRERLARVVREFQPDLIHSHHVWIVSALIKDVAPELPVVTHCHATGLRQMQLCPGLVDEVVRGCARNDRFLALHDHDAQQVASRLGLSGERVRVVGAGYRDELFHTSGREPHAGRIAYVGKYSVAKGLPWLLDAVKRLRATRPRVELHVVGAGSGPEAEALRRRMEEMAPAVRLHGTLSQHELAGLLRSCEVFVLPSFYEGVPLVVVEALACGCRPVATDLPGVREELAPHLGELLVRVPLPRLCGVDRPDPRDVGVFVRALGDAIGVALDEPAEPAGLARKLERFAWSAVFGRVASVWAELTRGR